MKNKYNKEDLYLISWEEVEEFIDKIYKKVNNFIHENNLKIKYISPIVRGGSIPAVKLSHMFEVIDMLPIQLKHNFKNQSIDIKIGLDYVKDTNIKKDECILLVEGNHCTGETANIALQLIKNKFGQDTKVIYVSLTRDYTYKDSVKDVIYTTWGMLTNESQELDDETRKKLNIKHNLFSVYPWENTKEELNALNSMW